MNPRLHAEHSASLFGGFSNEYLPVHELIDGNKCVSMQVFGRFYLHHIDIGGAIIEKILGENLDVHAESKTVVPTKDVILQHLLEDYTTVPTFTSWLDAFQLEGQTCPQPISEDELGRKIKSHPLLSTVRPEDIACIEDMIGLGMFTADENILKHPARFCIFAHALGIPLGVRILGEKTGGAYTIDVLAQYIEAKFGEIPTLLDYMEYITHQEWMYAPEYDRNDIEVIRRRLAKHEQNPQTIISPANDDHEWSHRPGRCNLD